MLESRLETEGFAGEPIGGGVERFNCNRELLGLSSVQQELCLQGQFNESNYNTSGKFYHLHFSLGVNGTISNLSLSLKLLPYWYHSLDVFINDVVGQAGFINKLFGLAV